MENNMQQLTPTKFIQTLTIIYSALLIGLLLFIGFVLFQFSDGMIPELDTNDTLLFIYPVIAIAAIYGSQAIFKKLVASAEKKPDLKSKLVSYQIASIIKFGLIEGSICIGIVLSLITGNTAYIAIAGVLIVYFLMQRPTRTKIESDLNLHGELRNQFQRYDEVID
ncbi:hypothetical protein IMCC3317_44540 [Kordia antarctica]|uniref:Uncharacterized protein n=1 Tax=Kordia antarctica TaxID=1218801 RepID=A0A7L4ZQN8_9FLAO|nr:hypothetical protein [Kordia antarctica]QHI39053.1 hypothetical protein IMCC3317_44540 [Kordia antarctica]